MPASLGQTPVTPIIPDSNQYKQKLLTPRLSNRPNGMSTAETVENEEPEDGTWDAIRKLPPSAKLVAKVLENEDTLTQSELAEETLLSPRTVRYAVSRLEEVDAVESQFSFSDARKRLYSLDVEGTTPSH